LEGIKELFFTFMEESYYKRRKQEIKQRKQEQGRPSRKDLAKNSPGGRGKPGRPKGDATIINEYKARMLASPKSKRVLDTIFDAALDHDHKNQAAAWKLVMDRILPVAAFEKDVVQNGGKSAIQINITGVGTAEVKDIDPTTIQPTVIEQTPED
jgi:hypothetical protein